MQQPRPISCSSCQSSGHVECKWCAGTGFFILGNNMLCEVPSRNTKCVICSGKVVYPCYSFTDFANTSKFRPCEIHILHSTLVFHEHVHLIWLWCNLLNFYIWCSSISGLCKLCWLPRDWVSCQVAWRASCWQMS